MDANEFRAAGKEMIDFIADYLETIREREVLPSVEPGYLRHLLPSQVPLHPDKWADVVKDVNKIIMPGLTHWQSPRFHAYYPAGCSYPSILGELLSAGLGVVGFNWMTNPAGTELEVVMMDWLAKLFGLPSHFLSTSDGPGGGIIQGSASEIILICLLAAKEKSLQKEREKNPHLSDSSIRGRLVAYSSDQSNSAVEKAGRLATIPLHLLESDKQCRLRGQTLRAAILDDLAKGLIPTYVCATLGTTATCAFDCLEEIGEVCQEFGVWLHVDAAYGGGALVCPEFRHLLKGVDYADSFVFNPHKWFLVNFDCSALWVKDYTRITNVFAVDRIYFKHQKEGHKDAPDFRNWEIPLGRRFRALKVWFTLRMYGVTGLQNFIRKQIGLARMFHQLVLSDQRFEIVAEVTMGLVCFRLKGDNSLTKRLLSRLTAKKDVYLIAAEVQDVLFIRFAVSSSSCEAHDIHFAWEKIKQEAHMVFSLVDDADIKVSDAVKIKSTEEELFIRKNNALFPNSIVAELSYGLPSIGSC